MQSRLAFLLLGVACVSTFAFTDASRGAGFDCSKASSKVEKLICSNQQLSSLDDRLGEVYGRVLKKEGNKDALRKDQQTWMKIRDACQEAVCVQKAYEERIAALESDARENPQASPQTLLKELNENFTFKNRPINPRAVQELFPIISDKLPGPVAVDVEGTTADTNRYLADVALGEKGVVTATWQEGDEKLRFSYKRLGSPVPGVYALETWANGGGTLVETDIILVKFIADTEYSEGGKARDRLLLMRIGAFALGDRYNGSVEVRPNEIVIGAGAERTKPERITIR